MSYRTDKFQVGDKVTWFDEEFATMTEGRALHGNGPFEITKVHNRSFHPYDNEDGVSNWKSMGHTQHVEIDGNKYGPYSGAFFKKCEA